jgi:hypothetical protein
MDEAAFWRIVESVRVRGNGDPYAMADLLKADFADTDDETLRAYEQRFIAISRRLYTWRHWDAAEIICGGVSDDVFLDFRSWVISLGRETFTRVVESPDNLADAADLSGSCDGDGEFFGAAVSGIYYARHGAEDENFPNPMTGDSPSGPELHDPQTIRRALPRLAARYHGDDGLGQPPREPVS